MNTFPKTKIFFILFFSFLFLLFLVGVSFVFAEDLPEYQPLVAIPGLDQGSLSIPGFINAVYKIIIGLGALFGVIKIALAGVKYSMSDIVTDKASAKKDILGVLLGLAILLMPYIVLNAIYPGLLNLDFTKNLPSLGEDRGGGGESSWGNPSDLPDGATEDLVYCGADTISDEKCAEICAKKVPENHTLIPPIYFKSVDEGGGVNKYCTIRFKEDEFETYTQSIGAACSLDEQENPVDEVVCKNACIAKAEKIPNFVSMVEGSLETRIDADNPDVKRCSGSALLRKNN